LSAGDNCVVASEGEGLRIILILVYKGDELKSYEFLLIHLKNKQ
jgi:hypothetical protein